MKMSAYGLVRFGIGVFPEQARQNAPWIVALANIGIIYGALVAMVQPNMKKLIAYSSVSHLGFVVLGTFSFTQAGIDGAVYQMLNHGISTGALFILAGIIYERRHTYDLKQFGGLATPMPVYATFFLIITLSSIGLPLMNGFVGEFLVLSGAFQAKAIFGILAASGVILLVLHILWMYKSVFYGSVTVPMNNTIPDLNGRKHTTLTPKAVMALVMGVWPTAWLNSIDAAVTRSVAQVPSVSTKSGPELSKE